MATLTEKIAIAKIDLDRWEGPTNECGEVTVSNLEQAEAQLNRWSRTAPKTGGYNKIGFKLYFADGETYEGRYDLSFNRTEQDTATLIQHVRNHCRFYSGRLTAEDLAKFESKITEPEYRVMLARLPEGEAASYGTFLDTYDLGL